MEKKRNPLQAVLLGIGIAILSGLLIPVVITALLSLLGIIALGVAVPEIGVSLLILMLLIGLPVYFITLAVTNK